MFIHCLLDLLIQHQYITTIMSKTVKLPNEVSLATGVQLDSLSAVPVFTRGINKIQDCTEEVKQKKIQSVASKVVYIMKVFNCLLNYNC